MTFNEKKFTDLETLLLGGPYGAFRFEVERHFDTINSFLEDSEIVLNQRKIELEKKYNSEIEKLEWSDIGYQSGELYELQKDFEMRHVSIYDILYNSTFLSAFSLFETSLRILYDKLFFFDSAKFNPSKSIKWDIARFLLNFKLEFNIDFERCESWKKILHFKEIRNAIAHRNCVIKSDNDTPISNDLTYLAICHFRENINLKEEEMKFRILNKNFILEFHSVVLNFYKELENSLRPFFQ